MPKRPLGDGQRPTLPRTEQHRKRGRQGSVRRRPGDCHGGPDLTGNERFGVSANWGNFDGSNAFGMGFEGVLWNDLFATGGRFAVTGGFGVGAVDNGHTTALATPSAVATTTCGAAELAVSGRGDTGPPLMLFRLRRLL